MGAIHELMAGRFREAVAGFEQELFVSASNTASLDGLSKALQGMGDYRRALPILERVNAHQVAEVAGSPGQSLALSCAYWCLEERPMALELSRNLCSGILSGSITMAPDLAAGATFGLILHYMAVTAADRASLSYALSFLETLNTKFNRRPTRFSYPVQTVKQILGQLSFDEVLETITGERSLSLAQRAAKSSRQVQTELGTAVFHNGALLRASGDEVGCLNMMRLVFGLGYQAGPIRWQLSRHELQMTPE